MGRHTGDVSLRKKGRDVVTVLQQFKPSIDWGHAVPDSLWWIARAWMISAVCVVVVLVLLRFTTKWARQYWRITGGYFTG